mgnify:CR=1 FL=1
MIRIAINGFGRIGRIFFRQAFSNADLDIVAVNDLGSPENLAYLLKYDTVYGRYAKNIETTTRDGKSYLVISTPPSPEATEGRKQEILVLSEKDPSKLPWKDLGIDIVIESTGAFDSKEKSLPHIQAGAKRVVITAPAKDDVTVTATPGLGMQNLSSDTITSNGSCTTNAINPVIAVLMSDPGVKKAMLTTVHAYTALQGLVDGPDRGTYFRRSRAAAQNIVPYITGAAKTTTKVLTELEGKFDGLAIRVPVISGSLIDITFLAARPTSVEEINNIFKEAAAKPEWQGILTITEEQLVSSDILGNPHGSIVDLALTKVVDGDLVKVFAWYDNEWGYCAMLLKHVLAVASIL